MRKYIAAFTFLMFLFSCSSEKIELKWRIPNDKQINYKVCTRIINDSTTYTKGDLYDPLTGKINNEIRGKMIQKDARLFDFWNNLYNEPITDLEVDCENFFVYYFDKKTYFELNQAKGELLSDGKVKVKNENPGYSFLYNVLVELPQNNIQTGDKWHLNISGFNTDKAKNDRKLKNNVYLKSIDSSNNYKSANIEFDISSGEMNKLSGGIDFDFTGTGSFNLDKGRWEKLKGIVTYRSTSDFKLNISKEIELMFGDYKHEITVNTNNNTSDTAFNTQALKGVYGGENWVLISGRAIINPVDTSQFILEFYNVNLDDPCGVANGDKIISTTCTRKMGVYNFEDSKFSSVFFNTNGGELKTNFGSIEINHIDMPNMLIKGKLNTWYNNEYKVSGDFSIKYCEDFFYDTPIIFQYKTYFDKSQKFKVQILASKTKIPLNSRLYSHLKYKVTETYDENEPVYKYKYRIGEGYFFDKAMELKLYARSNGFKGAFLVKVK